MQFAYIVVTIACFRFHKIYNGECLVNPCILNLWTHFLQKARAHLL